MARRITQEPLKVIGLRKEVRALLKHFRDVVEEVARGGDNEIIILPNTSLSRRKIEEAINSVNVVDTPD